MEFETMHDREFYLEMAKDYPMLEEIIAGEKGFAERFGELILALEDDENGALENLQGYLAMLSKFSVFEDEGISSTGSQALQEYESWTLSGDKGKQNKKKANTIGYSSIATMVGGGLLGLALFPAALILIALGNLGVAGAGFVQDKARNRKKEALSLLQEIVEPFCEQMDYSVITTFAASYFTNSRDHFEQNYPLLEKDQRELVGAQLRSYLGAGGMPGMDQNQLNDYLKTIGHYQLETKETETYSPLHHLKLMCVIARESILHPLETSYVDRETLEVERK